MGPAGSAGVLVNMSVWESVEALAAYVYSDAHRQVLRRRRRWFERMAEAYAALWWIPRGHTRRPVKPRSGCCICGSSGPRRTRSRSGSTSRHRTWPAPADPQPGRMDMPGLSARVAVHVATGMS